MSDKSSVVTELALHNQIVVADEARVAALLARDKVALDSVLSDDLVYVHSSGSEESKALYIERVTQGHYTYRSFVTVRRALVASDGLVFDNGDAEIDVVVSGSLRQVAGRYLMVWKKESGLWKLFRFHSSPIPRSAK